MDTLCSELVGHIIISTEDPSLIASNVHCVCKLWKSLVELEVFWKELFTRLYLFTSLRAPLECWRKACLRLGKLDAKDRTELLLSSFDCNEDLQLEVKSMFSNIGHTFFPYFAPLHRIYPGGYALLLFKINKVDTQHSMEGKLQAMKDRLSCTDPKHRLSALEDFWTTEVQFWRGVSEADSKEELQVLGSAMRNGNLAHFHTHMKVWFDKIQMWIMGPSHLFENLFQKEVIYNKEFFQAMFPDNNYNNWVTFWREVRLQSLVSMEDL